MSRNTDSISELGGGLSEYINSSEKRRLDVVTSSLLLGPAALMSIPIVAAIRLDSPGQALIRTPRSMGRGGEVFLMPKFRTLLEGTENDKFMVFEDDPRITRVGTKIRRPGLDEIPQLWEVLRNRASMVGPRALHPDELDYVVDTADDLAYAEYWSDLRELSKSGLTGPVQVVAHTGTTPFDRIRLEVEYLEHGQKEDDLRYIGQTALLPLGMFRRFATETAPE